MSYGQEYTPEVPYPEVAGATSPWFPSPEEYKKGLHHVLKTEVDAGNMTALEAARNVDVALGMLAREGVSQRLPFFGAAFSGMTLSEYQLALARTRPQPSARIPGVGFPASRGAGRPVSELSQYMPKMGGLPSAQQAYYGVAEGLPTQALQAYYKSQYPYLFTQFGGEEKREDWWTELARRKAIASRATAMRGAIGETKARATKYVATSPGYGVPIQYTGVKGLQAGLTQTYGQKIASAKKLGQQPLPEDPWLAYLRQYPFLQKFMEMSPEQRGYYPSTYAPFTQWV